jgi:predicted Ser/Thr protein kinase
MEGRPKSEGVLVHKRSQEGKRALKKKLKKKVLEKKQSKKRLLERQKSEEISDLQNNLHTTKIKLLGLKTRLLSRQKLGLSVVASKVNLKDTSTPHLRKKQTTCILGNSRHTRQFMFSTCTNNGPGHTNQLLSKLPNTTLVSERVLRYEMSKKNEKVILGQGSFGCVYMAHLIYIDKPVAVKRLLTPNVDLLMKEARIMQMFCEHPAFPYIYGTMNNSIVMEFIGVVGTQGPISVTLSLCLKEKSLSSSDFLALARSLADGMAFMHSKGILHNDLKENNVLVAEYASFGYRPKITDFGKATFTCKPRIYNIVPGTPEHYEYNQKYRHIAHELRNVPNSKQTEATDVYSYGRILKSICFLGGVCELEALVKKCKNQKPVVRPSAKNVVEEIDAILTSTASI